MLDSDIDDMTGIQMNNNLLRQRRNLMAISLFLIIFDIANIKIEKISFLGIELFVGNVGVIMYMAWLMWAYFLLRYFQYFNQEKTKIIRQNFIHFFDRCVYLFSKNNGGRDSLQSYSLIREKMLNLILMGNYYDPSEGGLRSECVKRISIFRIIGWSIKSALQVSILTPYATDRVLPFIMAAAALMISIFTKYA